MEKRENKKSEFIKISEKEKCKKRGNYDDGIKKHPPRRISTGSLRPALAKSTNIFGNVALNKTICFESGRRFKVSFNCSPNPISKSRSASSKTTYSEEKKKFSFIK